MIEHIKESILLLSLKHGIANAEVNLSDLSWNIELCAIGLVILRLEICIVNCNNVLALIAKMITPSDFDAVCCLVCGAAPKIVYTDGNTKVSPFIIGQFFLHDMWDTKTFVL